MNNESSSSSRTKPCWLMVLPWSIEHKGGVNTAVRNLTTVIKRRGHHEPTVLVSSWSDKIPTQYKVDGIRIIQTRLRPVFDASQGVRVPLSYLIFLYSNIRKLKRLLEELNVEVVHVQFPGTNSFVFALLKHLGWFRGALIYTFHGRDVGAIEDANKLQRILWSAAFKQSDAVVTCSKHLAHRLVCCFDSRPPDVRVINYGVESSIADKVVTSPTTSVPGSRFLLNVGKFEEKKAQDVLISSFERLAGAHDDLRLVLLGASGPTLDKTRDKVAIMEPSISKRINIVVDADHSTVLEYMRAAEVFVLPSRDEPFGIVLLEAGLTETPIVATLVGGIPEVIADGKTGLLVPPDNEEALTEAIELLLSDTALRDSLSVAHKNRVLEEFSWDRYTEYYYSLLPQ